MAEPGPLRLGRARIGGRDGLWDVDLEGARVVAVAPAGATAGFEPVDLDGRYLLPGMWDEHVHFTQWALYRSRIDVARARSAAEAADILRSSIGGTGTEIVVGVGFHDALWPDAPTAELLDRAIGDRPVVLLSADLHCAWLSSAASRNLGVEAADGVVREQAAFDLQTRLENQPDEVVDALVADAAAAAAARGIVGIVDFEMTWNAEPWRRRLGSGHSALRVEFGVYPGDLERAIAEGLRTGTPLDDAGLVTAGCLKVLVDGSLGTRTAYCSAPYPDPAGLPAPHGLLTVPRPELIALLRRAAENGIAPAVHAIGDAANRMVLDVYEELGLAGRIEHAQLVAPQDLARFGRPGMVASVQPQHAMDDRDIAERHWGDRLESAFPYGALAAAGARLAFGSDAPVAAVDPWIAMAAAVFRTDDDRPAWLPQSAVSRQVALESSTRGRGAVEAGQPADLVVVESDPLAAPDAASLRTTAVAATLLGGRFTHTTL